MKLDGFIRVGRKLSGIHGLIIVCFILVITSCVHKKAKGQLQPYAVKAIFKTELFTLRTDSLFYNGLMKNIEIYDETNRQLSHSFHFADSGNWGASDTAGSKLMLFHGVIYQLDSLAPNYISYEKATYYIRKPLCVSILRNNKIDATYIADMINNDRDSLFLLHGCRTDGSPVEATPFPLHFNRYSLSDKILGRGFK